MAKTTFFVFEYHFLLTNGRSFMRFNFAHI